MNIEDSALLEEILEDEDFTFDINKYALNKFYKKLKEQRVQNIEFVGTPRTAEKFEVSPSSIINYDYNVLIFGKEPRVEGVCP